MGIKSVSNAVLVDRYINTAYDKVKIVADNIDVIIAATSIPIDRMEEIVITTGNNLTECQVIESSLTNLANSTINTISDYAEEASSAASTATESANSAIESASTATESANSAIESAINAAESASSAASAAEFVSNTLDSVHLIIPTEQPLPNDDTSSLRPSYIGQEALHLATNTWWKAYGTELTQWSIIGLVPFVSDNSSIEGWLDSTITAVT